MAQKVREELVGSIPPGLRQRGDQSLAYDMAVHATNSAFEAAERVLERLEGNSETITRAVALVMFMQLMDAQVGAARSAMERVFTKLAVEAMVRNMGRQP
jgi:hypothetical protein